MGILGKSFAVLLVIYQMVHPTYGDETVNLDHFQRNLTVFEQGLQSLSRQYNTTGQLSQQAQVLVNAAHDCLVMAEQLNQRGLLSDLDYYDLLQKSNKAFEYGEKYRADTIKKTKYFEQNAEMYRDHFDKYGESLIPRERTPSADSKSILDEIERAFKQSGKKLNEIPQHLRQDYKFRSGFSSLSAERKEVAYKVLIKSFNAKEGIVHAGHLAEFAEYLGTNYARKILPTNPLPSYSSENQKRLAKVRLSGEKVKKDVLQDSKKLLEIFRANNIQPIDMSMVKTYLKRNDFLYREGVITGTQYGRNLAIVGAFIEKGVEHGAFEQRNLKQSKRIYEKALAMQPGNTELEKRLAKLAKKMGVGDEFRRRRARVKAQARLEGVSGSHRDVLSGKSIEGMEARSQLEIQRHYRDAAKAESLQKRRLGALFTQIDQGLDASGEKTPTRSLNGEEYNIGKTDAVELRTTNIDVQNLARVKEAIALRREILKILESLSVETSLVKSQALFSELVKKLNQAEGKLRRTALIEGLEILKSPIGDKLLKSGLSGAQFGMGMFLKTLSEYIFTSDSGKLEEFFNSMPALVADQILFTGLSVGADYGLATLSQRFQAHVFKSIINASPAERLALTRQYGKTGLNYHRNYLVYEKLIRRQVAMMAGLGGMVFLQWMRTGSLDLTQTLSSFLNTALALHVVTRGHELISIGTKTQRAYLGLKLGTRAVQIGTILSAGLLVPAEIALSLYVGEHLDEGMLYAYEFFTSGQQLMEASVTFEKKVIDPRVSADELANAYEQHLRPSLNGVQKASLAKFYQQQGEYRTGVEEIRRELDLVYKSEKRLAELRPVYGVPSHLQQSSASPGNRMFPLLSGLFGHSPDQRMAAGKRELLQVKADLSQHMQDRSWEQVLANELERFDADQVDKEKELSQDLSALCLNPEYAPLTAKFIQISKGTFDLKQSEGFIKLLKDRAQIAFGLASNGHSGWDRLEYQKLHLDSPSENLLLVMGHLYNLKGAIAEAKSTTRNLKVLSLLEQKIVLLKFELAQLLASVKDPFGREIQI